MDNKTSTALGNISTITSNLRNSIGGVNEKLKSKHLQSLHEDSESLLKYISTHRDDIKFVNDIQTLLLSTIQKCEEISTINADSNQHWRDEQAREAERQSNARDQERANRRSERADMWWLWSHQTLRWFAGAVLVFLTYSGAVYLSEKHPDYFHVPVKDLFPKVSAPPKS